MLTSGYYKTARNFSFYWLLDAGHMVWPFKQYFLCKFLLQNVTCTIFLAQNQLIFNLFYVLVRYTEFHSLSSFKFEQGPYIERTAHSDYFALCLLGHDFGPKRPVAPRDPANESGSFKIRINCMEVSSLRLKAF